jgi:hypothetical protein
LLIAARRRALSAKGIAQKVRVHQFPDDPEFTAIRAHRLVLANSSRFFPNIFSAGMQEAESGIVDVVYPPEPFVKVLRWMYGGQL